MHDENPMSFPLSDRADPTALTFMSGLAETEIKSAVKLDTLEWVSDYEVATNLAKEQNRRVFVLFTNSKTCAPCKIFKDNILLEEKFMDYAKKAW